MSNKYVIYFNSAFKWLYTLYEALLLRISRWLGYVLQCNNISCIPDMIHPLWYGPVSICRCSKGAVVRWGQLMPSLLLFQQGWGYLWQGVPFLCFFPERQHGGGLYSLHTVSADLVSLLHSSSRNVANIVPGAICAMQAKCANVILFSYKLCI